VYHSWIPSAATSRGEIWYSRYEFRIERKELEMQSVDGLPGCSGNPQGVTVLGRPAVSICHS
jgi:hypothetical protein